MKRFRLRHRMSALVRRHGRIMGAAVIIGLLIVGLANHASSDAPDGPTTPKVTYATTWTLLDLHRHLEAGDVLAITTLPVQAEHGRELLVLAKTTEQQYVKIDLSVSPTEAITALRALGYGRLLSADAVSIVSASSTNGGLDPLALSLGIMTIMLLGFILVRVVGGQRHAAHQDLAAARRVAGDPDGAKGVVPTVRLEDVAGCEEAKLELLETVEFLKNPDRFRALGAAIPRGILLYGPPGNGKTMLAKAVAAEAHVPFFFASGSDFVEKFVGVGAARVRGLFDAAKKAGRAVVFIDEIDAVARQRGRINGHDETDQTLNALLVEMDGFATTDDVIVIGATNRLDVLDEAILRPGRFTRKIPISMPDLEARREILSVHAKNKPLAPDVDLEALARKTAGFSGAMLADTLNEAAIFAARRGAIAISPEDVQSGFLKVLLGTSRRRSMDKRERTIIAVHEAGHAICGHFAGDRRRIEEISLYAHGDALGVTVSSNTDNALPTERDFHARLVALMGGRAAEHLIFGEVTPGAASDFEQANELATAMVVRFGMGSDPKTAGGPSGRGVLSLIIGRERVSTEVAEAQDRAIRALLDSAYERAVAIIERERAAFTRVASYLVEHERLDGNEFLAILAGDLEPSSLIAFPRRQRRSRLARPLQRWLATRLARRPSPFVEALAED
jgi:cell division protease FtsH